MATNYEVEAVEGVDRAPSLAWLDDCVVVLRYVQRRGAASWEELRVRRTLAVQYPSLTSSRKLLSSVMCVCLHAF
jgi:hypothetical protein